MNKRKAYLFLAIIFIHAVSPQDFSFSWWERPLFCHIKAIFKNGLVAFKMMLYVHSVVSYAKVTKRIKLSTGVHKKESFKQNIPSDVKTTKKLSQQEQKKTKSCQASTLSCLDLKSLNRHSSLRNVDLMSLGLFNTLSHTLQTNSQKKRSLMGEQLSERTWNHRLY